MRAARARGPPDPNAQYSLAGVQRRLEGLTAS
jgi:hypothetical protein